MLMSGVCRSHGATSRSIIPRMVMHESQSLLMEVQTCRAPLSTGFLHRWRKSCKQEVRQ